MGTNQDGRNASQGEGDSSPPEDRSKWTVQQWIDYAKAGNKDLRWANLEGADLEGVDLSEAVLEYATLVGANLYGASLAYASLGGAYLRGANLEDADLRGQDFDDLRRRVAGF